MPVVRFGEAVPGEATLALSIDPALSLGGVAARFFSFVAVNSAALCSLSALFSEVIWTSCLSSISIRLQM